MRNLVKEHVTILGIGNSVVLVKILCLNQLDYLLLSLGHGQPDSESTPLLYWCGFFVLDSSSICRNRDLLLYNDKKPLAKQNAILKQEEKEDRV